MKKFGEQLKKRSESVKLRAFERRDLRERLASYVEYHPLPAEFKGKNLVPEVQTSKATWLDIHIVSRYAGAFSVLILMIIPVLAENSVPGDVLYPVKVSFNEEIRSTFTLSPYQKVEWETERLERRIAEARLLATEGKLTPEVEAEVAEAVKQHSDAAQKEIAAIRENDSEDAVIAEITLASALEVQSEVLEGHAENNASSTDFGRSVAGLSGAISAARDTAVATQSTSQPSYEKLAAKVEMETTKAEELFYSIGDGASEEELVSIEERLAGIRVKIAKAIELNSVEKETVESEVATDESVDKETVINTASTSVASTSDGTEEEIEEVINLAAPVLSNKDQAIRLLRGALTDTQKLISFMTDIDVRLNVSIEELVPIVEDEEDADEPVDENIEEDIGEETASSTEDVATTTDIDLELDI